MKMSLKIALSLLISVVVFAIFFVIASSGLFKIVESSFYIPQIRESFNRMVEKLDVEINLHHQDNMRRFQSVLEYDYIPSAFLLNQTQSKDDIAKRDEAFKRLMQRYPALLSVRFIDEDGKFIYYSTLKSDLRIDQKDQRVYFQYDQVERSTSGPALVVRKDQEPGVMLDGKGNRIVYSFPITDKYDIYKGSALFFLSSDDLSRFIATQREIPGNESVAIVDNAGIVVGIPADQIEAIKDELLSLWGKKTTDGLFEERVGLSIKDDPSSGMFVLFSKRTEKHGIVSIIARKDAFEIALPQKIIIYLLFFITVYLTVFIIFNLKQDPVSVLSERIKYLQISFIKQFVESKEDIDWGKWQRELAVKRPEIARYIRKGIGKVSDTQGEEIDKLIEKGWDEILSVISRRAEQEDRGTGLDISRIEEIIVRALSKGNIVIPVRQAPDHSVKVAEPERNRREETVPEIAEAIEDVVDLEDAEEMEAAEEIEEMEPISSEPPDESLPVDDAGQTLATELEQDATLEEIEQVEDIEPVEELVDDSVKEFVEEAPDKTDGKTENRFISGETADDMETFIGDHETHILEFEEDVDSLEDIGTLEEIEEFEVEEKSAEPGVRELPETKLQFDHLDNIEEISLESFNETETDAAVESGKQPDADSTVIRTEHSIESDRVLPSHFAEMENQNGHAAKTTDKRIIISEDKAGNLNRIIDQVDMELSKKGKRPENIPSKSGEKTGARHDSESLPELEPVIEIPQFTPIEMENLDELELAEDPEEYFNDKRGGKYFLLQNKAGLSLVFAGRTAMIGEHLAGTQQKEGSGEMLPALEGEGFIQALISRSTNAHAVGQEVRPENSDREIETFIKTKKILVYSLADMHTVYSSLRKSIIVEDGVYRVKKELFADDAGLKNEDFRDLVAAVSHSDRNIQSRHTRESESLELDHLSEKRILDPKIIINNDGIDFDAYIRHVSKKTDDITIIKSIVLLSKKLESIYAGLITEQDNVYIMEYSVGLQDQTKINFKFTETDPFVRLFFSNKMAFILNIPVEDIASLKNSFSDYDRKFLNGLAFLPATFREKTAYLFLGFPSFEKRDLRNVFQGLGI